MIRAVIAYWIQQTCLAKQCMVILQENKTYYVRVLRVHVRIATLEHL